MSAKVLLLILAFSTTLCYSKPLEAEAILDEPLFREDVDLVSFDQEISRRISEPASVLEDDTIGMVDSKNLAATTEEVASLRNAQAVFPAGTAILTPNVLAKGPVHISATLSKFHTQDASGRASFGHTTVDQSALNFRDARGNQIGHFTYINPEGKEVIVQYTAGFGGFQALSNAQPEASAGVTITSPAQVIVGESPDVIKARQEHLVLFEEARTRIKHPKILQSIKQH